jgi:hypothetical protein
MNSPRFKSPALIELTTNVPGVSSVTLSRDVKVVDGFAFAHDVVDGAFFRVLVLDGPTQQSWNLLGEMMLVNDTIVRASHLNSAKSMVKNGQTLSVFVEGSANVTVCLWVIPQAK